MISIQVAFFHVIKLLQITVPDVTCPSYANKVTADPGIWREYGVKWESFLLLFLHIFYPRAW